MYFKLFKTDKCTIYVPIDHMEKGTYKLKILENNKVIKTFNIYKK